MTKTIKLWQGLLITLIVAVVLVAAGLFYVSKLRDGAQQLYDGAQKLSDGSGQVADGLKSVDDGHTSLKDGLTTYTGGVATVNDGLGTLQGGLVQYTDGVSQVNNGMLQLKNSIPALSRGVKQLYNGSVSAKNGVKQYTDGVAQLNGGLKNALPYGNQLFGTFIGTQDEATLSKVADKIVAEGANNDYTTATAYAKQMVIATVFEGDANAYNTVMAGTYDEKTLSSGITTYLGQDEYQTKVKDALSTDKYQKAVRANMSDIKAKVRLSVEGKVRAQVPEGTSESEIKAFVDKQMETPEVTEQISVAAVSLAAATTVTPIAAIDAASYTNDFVQKGAKQKMAASMMDQYPKLIAGSAVMYKAVHDCKYGSDTLVANNKALNSGMAQLSDGLKQLNSNVPTMSSGINQLYGGTSQLTANNAAMLSGLQQLKDGTQKLTDNNASLMDGVGQLSDGSGKLVDGSKQVSDGMNTLTGGIYTLLKGVGGK
jgi:putative membrane protein